VETVLRYLAEDVDLARFSMLFRVWREKDVLVKEKIQLPAAGEGSRGRRGITEVQDSSNAFVVIENDGFRVP
jgi:hypothetical protein